MLRKSIGSFLAVLVVVALAAPSFGAVIASGVLAKDPAAGNPFNAPDAALGAPWQSYVLSLTANGADSIQAVTVNINGQLHQRWTDPDGGGAHAATGNSTNKLNGDSHLLGAAGMLFASGPTEDNPGTGSPLSAGNNDSTKWGVGTNLAGTFGPPGAALTAFELAYIVVPSAPSTPLTIAVSALNPTGDVIGTFSCTDFLSAAVCGGGPPTDQQAPQVSALVRDFTLGTTDPATLLNLQLTATDASPPIVWSALAQEGPGKNFAGSTDPTITPDGKFSWNPNGWKQGAHTFKFTVTDSVTPTANSAAGVLALTVNLTVPEPATFTMVGLALVGFVGFARRRS